MHSFYNVSILQNMILVLTTVFFSIYFPQVFCFVDNLHLKMTKGSSVVKIQNFPCGGCVDLIPGQGTEVPVCCAAQSKLS